MRELCQKIGLPHRYWPQGSCQYCGEIAPAIAAKDAEIAKLREALEPFAKIARIVLSEAPADADYCSLYQDCEGVSHRVTMDECRALVKAGEA